MLAHFGVENLLVFFSNILVVRIVCAFFYPLNYGLTIVGMFTVCNSLSLSCSQMSFFESLACAPVHVKWTIETKLTLGSVHSPKTKQKLPSHTQHMHRMVPSNMIAVCVVLQSYFISCNDALRWYHVLATCGKTNQIEINEKVSVHNFFFGRRKYAHKTSLSLHTNVLAIETEMQANSTPCESIGGLDLGIYAWPIMCAAPQRDLTQIKS